VSCGFCVVMEGLGDVIGAVGHEIASVVCESQQLSYCNVFVRLPTPDDFVCSATSVGGSPP
jgi:hypothetical protein